MPPLEECRPSLGLQDFPVLDRNPIPEKLKSEISDLVSNSKSQLITLLLEGDQDVAVDRKQVKEAIEYPVELLLDTLGEAEFFKAVCNSYNRFNDRSIEECYATEFGREEDKKRSNQSEEHEREEERKKREEERIRLFAELDTLKASEAELEQNAIALEHELKFLRSYYQDSMTYYMSKQHQYPPPWSNYNVLHLEHHLWELRDKVAFLNEELEYERCCSDYYKQQCDEYSTDKKFMNQAYQGLEEKYAQERNLKDRLVKRLNTNLEKQKDLRTENETFVEALRKIFLDSGRA